jgi:hypothetical protein
MRSDPEHDCTVPAFTLACPGFHRESRGRQGGLTFTLDNQVTAEIGHADLIESWQAACDLSPAEALLMSAQAARHLGALIESGVAAADLTEAVTDAAVVLLLAMKRAGVARPERIPACTIMWNGQEGRERVVLGA